MTTTHWSRCCFTSLLLISPVSPAKQSLQHLDKWITEQNPSWMSEYQQFQEAELNNQSGEAQAILDTLIIRYADDESEFQLPGLLYLLQTREAGCQALETTAMQEEAPVWVKGSFLFCQALSDFYSSQARTTPVFWLLWLFGWDSAYSAQARFQQALLEVHALQVQYPDSLILAWMTAELARLSLDDGVQWTETFWHD